MMLKKLLVYMGVILLVVSTTLQCQPQTYRQVKVCCEKPPDVVVSFFPNYYIILYNVSTECFYVPVPASNNSGKIALLYKSPLKNAYSGLWINITPSTDTMNILTTQEISKKSLSTKKQKIVIYNQTYLLILLTSGLAEAYPIAPQSRTTSFTAPAEATKTAETGFNAERARPIKQLLFVVLPYILLSLIVSVLVYALARKAVQYNEEQAKAN